MYQRLKMRQIAGEPHGGKAGAHAHSGSSSGGGGAALTANGSILGSGVLPRYQVVVDASEQPTSPSKA